MATLGESQPMVKTHMAGQTVAKQVSNRFFHTGDEQRSARNDLDDEQLKSMN